MSQKNFSSCHKIYKKLYEIHLQDLLPPIIIFLHWHIHSRGESQVMYITYMPLPGTNKAVHSGFGTQRRCHCPKQWYQWTHKCVQQKFFFKKSLTRSYWSIEHVPRVSPPTLGPARFLTFSEPATRNIAWSVICSTAY